MTKYTFTEKKDTRSGFGEGLHELGKSNSNVVALCADLTGSLKMDAFKKDFPERFFQVGIAEANMMGLAAGMSIVERFLSREHLPTFLRGVCMIKYANQSLTPVRMLRSVLPMQV
jgi:transketolase C-terminal domain/subunit